MGRRLSTAAAELRHEPLAIGLRPVCEPGYRVPVGRGGYEVRQAMRTGSSCRRQAFQVTLTIELRD